MGALVIRVVAQLGYGHYGRGPDALVADHLVAQAIA
jgi:hypothetical protein